MEAVVCTTPPPARRAPPPRAAVADVGRRLHDAAPGARRPRRARRLLRRQLLRLGLDEGLGDLLVGALQLPAHRRDLLARRRRIGLVLLNVAPRDKPLRVQPLRLRQFLFPPLHVGLVEGEQLLKARLVILRRLHELLAQARGLGRRLRSRLLCLRGLGPPPPTPGARPLPRKRRSRGG